MKVFLFCFLTLSVVSHAETFDVCASCDYITIKSAIEKAKDGDTITVRKGIYKETEIFVNRSLVIIGKDLPILHGENKQESIFAVEADNFIISGFKFVNVGMSYVKEIAGVFLSHCNNFSVKDNYFEDVFYAFIIHRSSYGIIENNHIQGQARDESSSGNGIHVWKCENIRIERNKIYGMRDGIYLEFVKKSVISDNHSIDNIRYGLHFMFSDHNEYHHNEFRTNGAGVAVMYSKFIDMHHNTFHFNWGMASYGLLLKEINDATIENNYFEQNTTGINIDGCNRIRYRSNHFVRNGWALKFTGGCYANVFEYNNFNFNAFDLAYNGRLNDNRFDGNYWSEYVGYDLDRNGIGDVPYRPVKLFSFIVNRTPETIILMRSLFIDIINFSEKVSPIFTPDALVDNHPIMKPIVW